MALNDDERNVCRCFVQVNSAKWMFGDVMCDVWVACDVMCCTASIFNLTAICIDRCDETYGTRSTYYLGCSKEGTMQE